MDVVLFCLAVCFHFSWPHSYILCTSWFREVFSFMLLRGDWARDAQAAAGYTFPHWASNENSNNNNALLTLNILIVFLSRLMGKINCSYWFSHKNRFHQPPPPSVHSPITNVLAAYDADLPQWVPYFCNHQVSEICSAFMAPQWLGWPRLTWPTRPDCAMGSWAQSDYLLASSLSSPHPGWRLIALLISQAPQNIFASTPLLTSLVIIYWIPAPCWLLYEADFEDSPCVADGRMTKRPKRLQNGSQNRKFLLSLIFFFWVSQ